MTILHVQKVSGISGSEAHLLSLLPLLRARGWDARMLVMHQGEPGAADFLEAMTAKGVPVEQLRIRADLDPLAFGGLVARLIRRRPAVLHTHLVHADLYGLTAGALARVPVRVSTKHGFNEFRSRRWLAVADRAVGRLARRQIAISRGLADYLAEVEGFDADEFDIVHYGIAAGPEPPPYEGETPRLLAIGRLIPIKGFDVLLEAFAQARSKLPSLTLEIAGDGELRERLEASAGDGVTFLGRVNQIGPAIERAAVVVVPSRGEGFGMVALEAMERGRAVIASAVGGLPELVADGETGLLVPPEQLAPLADAIVEVATDLPRARAMGAAGRARARPVLRGGTSRRGRGPLPQAARAMIARYAVVSCHVERPLDDRVWLALSRLQERRPGGFAIAALLRPPDEHAGEDPERWLARAREVAGRGPLGHHTHWESPEHARPLSGDPGARVAQEGAWLREQGLRPTFFCGGGWYFDEAVAEAVASLGYADCTATSFRPPYLQPGAPRVSLQAPAWVELNGSRFLELPTTHSIGMLVRAVLDPRALREQVVHAYFHDTDLLDRRRAAALRVALALLGRRREATDLDRLAAELADSAPTTALAEVVAAQTRE